MKKTSLYFLDNLPSKKDFLQQLLLPDDDQLLFVFDHKLLKLPRFKIWITRFTHRYSVHAGEQLKSLDAFPVHVHKILKKCPQMNTKAFKIVSVGGGSVGDFSGFLASVLKRGVGLVHIPTTWLSAMDSAHGGKTALNVGHFKNQIGSFYNADKVFLIASILKKQPPALERSAKGELIKIAIIHGAGIFRYVQQNQQLDMVSMLPSLIKAKMKIVREDPLEKNGHRQILNLGHTVGHIIEGEYAKPHGESVMLGLLFSLRWSYQLKYINKDKFEAMERLILNHLSVANFKFYQKLLMPKKIFLKAFK